MVKWKTISMFYDSWWTDCNKQSKLVVNYIKNSVERQQCDPAELLKHQERMTSGLLSRPSNRFLPSLRGPDDELLTISPVTFWYPSDAFISQKSRVDLYHRIRFCVWSINTWFRQCISADWSGQGHASENIKAFNISYNTYYFSISSWTVQESCRISALTSAAPEQIKMGGFFPLSFFRLHAYLCGKRSSADCDMCEIQLRTCCGCTLCNPGRWGGRRRQEATLQAAANTNHSGLGRCQELGMCHHTAHRRSESGLRSLIITHSSLVSLRLSLSALRSVEKGMQQTLVDTSVYNSCPAPKIESSNSTHCFVAKIEARARGVKAACLQIKGDYLRTLEMTGSRQCRLMKPGGSVRSSHWTTSQDVISRRNCK